MTEQERQEMLATLEKEAADDLWDFMQEVAEGIKHPKGIKTDEIWPVSHNTVVDALSYMHIKRASNFLREYMLGHQPTEGNS